MAATQVLSANQCRTLLAYYCRHVSLVSLLLLLRVIQCTTCNSVMLLFADGHKWLAGPNYQMQVRHHLHIKKPVSHRQLAASRCDIHRSYYCLVTVVTDSYLPLRLLTSLSAH